MGQELRTFNFHAGITAVVVDPKTIRRLWTWTVAADTEISALGEVEVNGSTLYLTDRIYLLKQSGSMASTHFDMEAVDEFMRIRMKAKLPTETLRFWFHTHPRMEAWFSITDEENIKNFVEAMALTSDPFLLSAVFNTVGKSEWCLSNGKVRTLWSHFIPGHVPTIEECEEAAPLIEKYVEEERWFPYWRKVRRWKKAGR